LITKDIGGQALLTNDTENYPAFEHIGGFELMNKPLFRHRKDRSAVKIMDM